jgi:hypothetical protein
MILFRQRRLSSLHREYKASFDWQSAASNCSIGILEELDKFMPIGVANCKTWAENGRAIWELVVRGGRIPAQWVVVNGEFRETGKDC